MPFGSDIHVRFVVKGSPAHVSAPPGAPDTRSGIRPVIRPRSRRRTWTRRRRFPVVFRPPAFASWAPCPPGNSAPITLGLPPPHAPTCARGVDPDAGLPRSTRVRPGPGRALSLPRGWRCSLAIVLSVAAACRLTTADPYHPGATSQPGMSV